VGYLFLDEIGDLFGLVFHGDTPSLIFFTQDHHAKEKAPM
jgi:hypothetical protein